MTGHEDKISIFCHPKNPEKVETPWLRDRIIPNLVETSWGKITDAYFSLIHEALKDPNNQKFIVISESCLPLKSFDELYNFYRSQDIRSSFIKFWRLSEYDIGHRLKGNRAFRHINGEMINFIKHYARFSLSRYHALKLLNYSEDTPIDTSLPYEKNDNLVLFNNTEVGDEFFLSILNPRNGVDFIVNYEMTFDNWDKVQEERVRIDNRIAELNNATKKMNMTEMLKHMKGNLDETEKLKKQKKNLTDANPYSYEVVSQEDVDFAVSKESFFWRKFPVTSNVREFYDEQGLPISRRGRGRGRAYAGGKKHNNPCRSIKCKSRRRHKRRKSIRRKMSYHRS
jgi:hypothetical protein